MGGEVEWVGNSTGPTVNMYYVHATRKPNVRESAKSKPTLETDNPFIFRQMQFLPKQTYTSFTQIYSGEAR